MCDLRFLISEAYYTAPCRKMLFKKRFFPLYMSERPFYPR